MARVKTTAFQFDLKPYKYDQIPSLRVNCKYRDSFSIITHKIERKVVFRVVKLLQELSREIW